MPILAKMECQNIEFRAVTKEGANAKETNRRMADVYGDDSSTKYSKVEI